jgi:hypothetical protein
MNNEQKTNSCLKSTALLRPSRTKAPADAASAAERALNDAIVCADISNSYEEFLAIVDEFYSDAVEVHSAASPEPVTGMAHVYP